MSSVRLTPSQELRVPVSNAAGCIISMGEIAAAFLVEKYFLPIALRMASMAGRGSFCHCIEE